MRLVPLISSSAVILFAISPIQQVAQADPYLDALGDARRALQIAKLDARLYRQVEYPRQLRYLDAAIKLTKAEVDSYRRRLRDYKRFENFQSGNPFLVTLENAKLHLLEAELRLKDLKEERFALQRFRGDHCRLLELKVFQARSHLARLEGGSIVIVEQPALPPGSVSPVENSTTDP